MYNATKCYPRKEERESDGGKEVLSKAPKLKNL